jgi:hypothetical protein
MSEQYTLEDMYLDILEKMFNCKDTILFDTLLQEALNFIQKNPKCSTTLLFTHDYSIKYRMMDLFSIVYLKKKELLPVLKENGIKYIVSKRAYSPIYAPLIDRDMQLVDFLYRNGAYIISENGFVYFYFQDVDIYGDMVDRCMIEKNNTSMRYIYENTPVKSLLERHKNVYTKETLFINYLYDYIMPY